jgi:hypothetical protein
MKLTHCALSRECIAAHAKDRCLPHGGARRESPRGHPVRRPRVVNPRRGVLCATALRRDWPQPLHPADARQGAHGLAKIDTLHAAIEEPWTCVN